jgi:hypothetical protein
VIWLTGGAAAGRSPDSSRPHHEQRTTHGHQPFRSLSAVVGVRPIGNKLAMSEPTVHRIPGGRLDTGTMNGMSNA